MTDDEFVAVTGPALFGVDVHGRPATFATAHDKAWRAAVAETFATTAPTCDFDPATTLFKVVIHFRTPKATRASEAWDLDNLIKPTLDAMSSVFGEREGNYLPQPSDHRVIALEATKRSVRDGELPGARITVWVATES